jgi:hypothetical protein
MEQTAEAISTLHLAAEGDDRVGWRTRHSLLEALVRPGLVVVIEELGEHALQVLPAENQQVVQGLSASGPHLAFSERVRHGRPVRQADDLHALALEDLIEGGAEP